MDRTLYKVRVITPDGIINTVAGTGLNNYHSYDDGGPAVEASLKFPSAVAVAPSGFIYILTEGRVRVVDTNGIIRTVVRRTAYAGSGDGGLASQTLLTKYTSSLALAPDGSMYISTNNRVRVIKPCLPGFTYSNLLISSNDGNRVYGFDANGRHLRTLRSDGGGVLFSFGYDSNGYLESVVDRDGSFQ